MVISRHLSHACRVPAELFDILATHGGQLGKTVRDEQRESFNMLWQRACAPSGEASRRKPTPTPSLALALTRALALARRVGASCPTAATKRGSLA